MYHIQKSDSCHTENKTCVLYKTGHLMLFMEITSADYEKHKKHIKTAHLKTHITLAMNEVIPKPLWFKRSNSLKFLNG